MKRLLLKRLLLYGLATVLTLSAVALVGANSASTTALCNDEPKEGLCEEEGTFAGEASPANFETGVGTVSCNSFAEGYSMGPTPKGKTLAGEVWLVFLLLRVKGKEKAAPLPKKFCHPQPSTGQAAPTVRSC